jgi:hypothetical protein
VFEPAEKAPAGVTQASSVTRIKGAAMIKAEREKCDIASSHIAWLALAICYEQAIAPISKSAYIPPVAIAE